MKVQPLNHWRARKSKKAGFLRSGLFIVVPLLVLLSLTYVVSTNYRTPRFVRLWAHNRGHRVLREDIRLRKAILQAPKSLLQSLWFAEHLPKLVIDMKFKHFEKIVEKRADALAKGLLIQRDDDFVPASIRYEGRTIKVKLRLKGDLTDHLQEDKWSYRIHVKGDDQIFGIRRFSIHHPGARCYQAQILFFEILRSLGVLVPRYFFVDVTVNGKNIGIMALEEHFSKELLESSGRRESVILKFDESLHWDERLATGVDPVIFNSYKNAPIDAFRTSRIEKSETLSRDYIIALGLLRGFINSELRASDVFDVGVMGRFIAATELWGARHGVFFGNLRFYYNPITAKLEPIGFDSFRRLLDDKSFGHFAIEELFLKDLLKDSDIFNVYLKTLREQINDVKNGDILKKLEKTEMRQIKALRGEFFFLEKYPYDKVLNQADTLLELIENETENRDEKNSESNISGFHRKYTTILYAYDVQDPDGPYLEIANPVPDIVEIRSIKWSLKSNNATIPFEPLSDIKFPIRLDPTFPQTVPRSDFIYYQSPLERKQYDLMVTAAIQGKTHGSEIIARTYFPPLRKNPIPTSFGEELLFQHPFLSVDRENNSFYVKPGQWEVNGSLVLPPGFSLTIPAGIILRFKPQESLIVRGHLNFQGTKQFPVVLEGALSEGEDPEWQGMVVLEADEPSKWAYVTVRNTTGVRKDGWELTGGVTFYKSDIDMDHCYFHNSNGEDALNIIQSRFSLKEVRVTDTVSDALDSDFSEGIIEGGLFQDIGKLGGGDAIDVSGSRVEVYSTYFQDISDKALSIGERSKMIATDITIEKVGTGAASKDGSELDISFTTIKEAEYVGITAYVKKPEYGPATVDARDIAFVDNAVDARAQKRSSITIDGVLLESEDLDIEDLYETIMKPGFRE